jgi:hypothetical protein
MKKAKLFVVSEMDASILKKINMVPFDTIQEAYDQAIKELGENATTMIHADRGIIFTGYNPRGFINI